MSVSSKCITLLFLRAQLWGKNTADLQNEDIIPFILAHGELLPLLGFQVRTTTVLTKGLCSYPLACSSLAATLLFIDLHSTHC